ncbi:MAG: hypothetical protein KGJ62_11635 [Armatimonadetes bacterium]|nr:hypothetical protein [Armatimonadota bacterium]MDE2206778.1 hypothetical protein [Armatimonadota bacterium]
MTPTVTLFLTVTLASLPIIAYAAVSIRRLGVGAWLFTPQPTFYFSYLLNFLVRPILFFTFNFGYGLSPFDPRVFIESQILGTAGCWAFMAGYALLREKNLRARIGCDVGKPPMPADSRRQTCARQLAAGLLALCCMLIYAAFVAKAGALTLNIGENRKLFLAAVIGGGYLLMLNTMSVVFITVSVVCALYTGRMDKPGMAALALYVIVNSLVSTRHYVTSVIYITVFVLYIQRLRMGRVIRTSRIVAGLAAILVLGVGLGLLRGGTQQKGAFLLPLAYLTETFDMSEMLQETIKARLPLEWGRSWVEDVAYSFIPRQLFPNKPTVFGTTRLELEVAPGLAPLRTLVFRAVFPIGIYGEAYVNFGIPGIVLLMFGMGLFLRFASNCCLDLAYSNVPRMRHVFYLVIFGTLCADTLGYMRTFGQFLATIGFDTLLFAVCCLVVAVGRDFVLILTPKATPPAETSRSLDAIR